MALQKLATDPRALFLFFMERVATMAGARSAYNDALRRHMVLPVIIAFCQVRGDFLITSRWTGILRSFLFAWRGSRRTRRCGGMRCGRWATRCGTATSSSACLSGTSTGATSDEFS